MLVKCLDFLRKKGEPWQGVKVFGQEINALTSAIARMNLYLNGVEDFSIVREDTLAHPAFVDGSKIRKFDIVLANPPYSIKTWNREAFMNDKWGRNFLGTPPQGRADYAFFQHILASMNESTGRCAILFPHGILGRDEEKDIRQKLVEKDLIECVIGIGRNLFYNSPMEACVVICRTNKEAEKKDKTLFIDAKDLVTRKNGESYLEKNHIKEIVNAYNQYDNIPGFAAIATKSEILANEGLLSISLYVNQRTLSNYRDTKDLYREWSLLSKRSMDEVSVLINMLSEDETN